MDFILRSRFLFIDSSIFFRNNFQFLSSDLQSLSVRLALDEVTLLITEITIAEVKRHIKDQAREAMGLIQSFQKKAKILRNLPYFLSSPMFGAISGSQIEEDLLRQFSSFLSSNNIKIVSLDSVSPEQVFGAYFAQQPPFSKDKREEFRDAFILEALKNYAEEEGILIYVISGDSDMKSFCESSEQLIYIESLAPVINALAITSKVDTGVFASAACASVLQDIVQIVTDYLQEQEFCGIDDDPNVRLLDSVVSGLRPLNERVFAADHRSAKCGVDFEFYVDSRYLRSVSVAPGLTGIHLEVLQKNERYLKVLQVELFLSYYEGQIDTVYLEDYNLVLPDGDILWPDELIQQSDYLSL